MSVLDYDQRINEALQIDNPQSSVDKIKRTVIAEFEALDPTLQMKSTEYFNHSFVPDLVVKWSESGISGERYIYLRFNSHVGNLIEDISLVQDSQPIVFGLGRTPVNEEGFSAKLAEASCRSDTLVTDGFGIQKLVNREDSKFLDVAVNSLVQGGRGFIDEDAAGSVVTTMSDGFSGALNANKKLTGRAARKIETLFSQRSSNRMISLLQAAWAGGGGRLEDFPGRRHLMGKITDDALEFLLNYETIGDIDFWRKIGKEVTVGQLSGISLPAGSVNLDKFMQANIDRLWAKYCRVTDRRLDEVESNERRWFIGAGNLGLRGNGYEAHIAEKSDGLDEVPPETSSGIPLSELLARADGMSITEAELASNGRIIRYSSDDHVDISKDAMLINFAGEFRSNVFVKKISVYTSEQKNLMCDLTSATVSGRTRSQISIGDMVMTIVPLVRHINQEEMEELKTVLSPLIAKPQQLSIFEDSSNLRNASND